MILKENLKQAIDERGLKRSWVAEKVGISHPTLTQILNNPKWVTSLKTAIALAKILKVPLDDIWTEAR